MSEALLSLICVTLLLSPSLYKNGSLDRAPDEGWVGGNEMMRRVSQKYVVNETPK